MDITNELPRQYAWPGNDFTRIPDWVYTDPVIYQRVNCYPSLDHSAGRLRPSCGQGGCATAGQFSSSIGRLLPIALCGRCSL